MLCIGIREEIMNGCGKKLDVSLYVAYLFSID